MSQYEIIKGFEAAKNLFPLPDLPLENMETGDAIMLMPELNMQEYQRWSNRLNKICKTKKLCRTDYKISRKDGKLYVIRVYVTITPSSQI